MNCRTTNTAIEPVGSALTSRRIAPLPGGNAGATPRRHRETIDVRAGAYDVR